MPAAEGPDLMLLPRIPEPPLEAAERPIVQVLTAHRQREGAGFEVRRPFPGLDADVRDTDPFLLLDHIGPVTYAPYEARGAPWHPHRGFETVTYVLDGAFQHKDSNGGGGLIRSGDTQWMTAGSGILHDEMPPEELVIRGGAFHATQLWVNLPRRLKMTTPRYQDIHKENIRLLASSDGGALVRVIAGEIAGHKGPGVTWTPIDYLHISIPPGGRLRIPWRKDFNALVYVLIGRGRVGHEQRPIRDGQLAILGPGEVIALTAERFQESDFSDKLEVLVLGGMPIREPVTWYGPFVMNTREEILQAIEDFQSGHMGTIPATRLGETRGEQ
ncbi:MAG: pirin family protein [Limnochordaceae bacterium]|nr:pirin family protein [Limnochordaceae bacterium]